MSMSFNISRDKERLDTGKAWWDSMEGGRTGGRERTDLEDTMWCLFPSTMIVLLDLSVTCNRCKTVVLHPITVRVVDHLLWNGQGLIINSITLTPPPCPCCRQLPHKYPRTVRTARSRCPEDQVNIWITLEYRPRDTSQLSRVWNTVDDPLLSPSPTSSKLDRLLVQRGTTQSDTIPCPLRSPRTTVTTKSCRHTWSPPRIPIYCVVVFVQSLSIQVCVHSSSCIVVSQNRIIISHNS